MRNKPIKKSSLFRILGPFECVRNMDSIGRYSQVENQFILDFKNGRIYQSYNAIVAAFVKGKLYVNEFYHDYSNVTMKYCKAFTGMTAQQRRDGIKNGTIRTFEE